MMFLFSCKTNYITSSNYLQEQENAFSLFFPHGPESLGWKVRDKSHIHWIPEEIFSCSLVKAHCKPLIHSVDRRQEDEHGPLVAQTQRRCKLVLR